MCIAKYIINLTFHLLNTINLFSTVYMGNHRDKPDTNKITSFEKCNRLQYAVSSMCGWRLYMEDAHLAICPFNGDDNMGLFAVFDGHGGPQCAIFAKNHFEKCLVGNQYFVKQNYEKALIQTFLEIDALMQTKAGAKQLQNIREENVRQQNANEYKGQTLAGTTANVCLVTKQYVYVANAGDSRAIGIARQSKVNKAKVKQLSIDHKPENENEKKRIIQAGGTVSEEGRINDNLNLSRALGDFTYKKDKKLGPEAQIISAVPEIHIASRRQVSYILMGCDGIWERKSNILMAKWILKKIEKGNNLKIVVQSLLTQELGTNPQNQQQFGMDNMTAILIHLF